MFKKYVTTGGGLFLGLLAAMFTISQCAAWGFFAHKRINRLAVLTLPPKMMVWYKPHIEFITNHATDPDKLRYVIKEEAAHHYIDIDHYGHYPYPALPRKEKAARARFSEDTLQAYGVVPWNTLHVFYKLQDAFKRKDGASILKYSAFLGHYIADACVPLHASSNYDGQKTDQKGIHALWESEIPELLADTSFDLWTGKAAYVAKPGNYIWALVLESASAADTVLSVEKQLLETFPPDAVHAFIERKGKVVRSYSVAFAKAYNQKLHGMVARRMRRAIHAVSSLWYTAWINAGQPDLQKSGTVTFDPETLKAFKELDQHWHGAGIPSARQHE